jgi:hypothetical protein
MKITIYREGHGVKSYVYNVGNDATRLDIFSTVNDLTVIADKLAALVEVIRLDARPCPHNATDQTWDRVTLLPDGRIDVITKTQTCCNCGAKRTITDTIKSLEYSNWTGGESSL